MAILAGSLYINYSSATSESSLEQTQNPPSEHLPPPLPLLFFFFGGRMGRGRSYSSLMFIFFHLLLHIPSVSWTGDWVTNSYQVLWKPSLISITPVSYYLMVPLYFGCWTSFSFLAIIHLMTHQGLKIMGKTREKSISNETGHLANYKQKVTQGRIWNWNIANPMQLKRKPSWVRNWGAVQVWVCVLDP